MFAQFQRDVTGKSISKIYSAAHNVPVLKDNGAKMYCMKEETRVEGPWEFGEYKDRRLNAKITNTERAKRIREEDPLELVKEGDLNMLHLRAAMFYKNECLKK